MDLTLQRSTSGIGAAITRTLQLIGFAICIATPASCQREAEPPPTAPVPTVECDTDGQACERSGLAGSCLRERCILPSGHCTYDLDCDDGNACSRTWCDDGACRLVDEDGGCSLDNGAPGACISGTCAPSPPSSCATDGDCPKLDDACVAYACLGGACQQAPRADGQQCRMESGLVGACASSRCSADVSGEAKNPDVCTTRYSYYWGVYYKDCTTGLRYRMAERRHETPVGTTPEGYHTLPGVVAGVRVLVVSAGASRRRGPVVGFSGSGRTLPCRSRAASHPPVVARSATRPAVR